VAPWCRRTQTWIEVQFQGRIDAANGKRWQRRIGNST
jgi:hypothetical protein